MSAVGLYLMTVSSGQVQAVSQDEQAARAYQAARTGIDWGAYQVLINNSCPGPAATSLPLAQAGLPGVTFYASVTCSSVGTETEAGSTVHVYKVTSTGCNQTPCATIPSDPGATYVERELVLNLTCTDTPATPTCP